jgi:site-specific DNA-adenine methylase
MVKEINIIRRIGSKQTDIKHFSKYLPLDVKTVVEPFGGSFAVSKFFYKDINKYNFHINDLDEEIYYIYKNFQEYIKLLSNLQDCCCASDYKTNYFEKYLPYVEKANYDDHIKNYIHKNFVVRKSLLNLPYKQLNFNNSELNILNNSLFTNNDYKDVIKLYIDDKDAFVFLDPPYLFSNNTVYIPQQVETDMTMIIPEILDFFKVAKCKIMLIINKLNIIEYCFKDYIKGEYNKTYRISNKKSIHLIITNYDL